METKTEEKMGWQHEKMVRNSLRAAKDMEIYCGNVICGAPTTVKVKELRSDDVF